MGFYNYLLSNQLLDQSQVSVKRLDRADNIYLSIFKKKWSESVPGSFARIWERRILVWIL